MSDRAGVDESQVFVYSRAVAAALSLAATDELETAREQLPPEFAVIFEPGGPITRDGFLETVNERAGVDSDDVALSAANATLHTLGERLSEGKAADLALYLPETLEEAILESNDEPATDYSLDEFVQQVSQHEDVDRADTKTHVQAVCSTLAETASEREIKAIKKQLPDQFGVFFEPPDTENGEKR